MDAMTAAKKDIQEARKAQAKAKSDREKALKRRAKVLDDFAGVLADAMKLDASHPIVEAAKRDAAALLDGARAKAAGKPRMALVEDRLQGALARAILSAFALYPQATWLGVTKDKLRAALRENQAAPMDGYDVHPGSAAGLLLVDVRDRDDFATRDGKLTAESVLARVKGREKP